MAFLCVCYCLKFRCYTCLVFGGIIESFGKNWTVTLWKECFVITPFLVPRHFIAGAFTLRYLKLPPGQFVTMCLA